jgi:hypothetical protein
MHSCACMALGLVLACTGDDLLEFEHLAQGICGVAIYHDAVLSLIYVDLNFPSFVPRDSTGAWPAAVEKALAKCYGSYHAISGAAGTGFLA